MEVVSYLNKSKTPGVIAIVDFEKCFDWVHFQSIYKAFEYFNFGPKFIHLLSILYTDFQICTSNKGFISETFVKG